jgi:hypothetical protein
MFRVPQEWRLNADGTRTRYIETEQFRASLEYARKLYDAGAYHADAVTMDIQKATAICARRKRAGSGRPDEPSSPPPPRRTVQMAVVVVATLPILLVYPFLQRHFTRGVLTGAIKGWRYAKARGARDLAAARVVLNRRTGSPSARQRKFLKLNFFSPRGRSRECNERRLARTPRRVHSIAAPASWRGARWLRARVRPASQV